MPADVLHFGCICDQIECQKYSDTGECISVKCDDGDVVAGLFVDALQHWLNSEQHLLVVVDPSDDERRASQVQAMGLKSRSFIEWVFKLVVETEGWVCRNCVCWGEGGAMYRSCL